MLLLIEDGAWPEHVLRPGRKLLRDARPATTGERALGIWGSAAFAQCWTPFMR